MNPKIPDRPFAWFELQHLELTSYELRCELAVHSVRRLMQAVYAPAHLEDTIELRAEAAQLVLTDAMVLADRTAAWLHGVDHYRLDDLQSVPPLEVVSVDGANRSRRRGTYGARRTLTDDDICRVAGVPVTTPARTAADLACLFGRHDALAVLDAFMREAGVTRADLDRIVARFAGRRGVTQLRELVALATPKSESSGESWTRLEIEDAGLPTPTPQFSIVVNGREKYRLDLAYPEWKIAIEYDGRAHHSSAEDRKRDEKRRAWLRRQGWIVIVVTKDDLRSGSQQEWLVELRRALDDRMPRPAKRRYARAARSSYRRG